jgi:hypothetical protein
MQLNFIAWYTGSLMEIIHLSVGAAQDHMGILVIDYIHIITPINYMYFLKKLEEVLFGHLLSLLP